MGTDGSGKQAPMAVPRLATRGSGRRFGGIRGCACLLLAAGAVAPAGAGAATPTDAVLQQTTEAIQPLAQQAPPTVDRVRDVAPAVRQTVGTTIRRAIAAEPVRSALEIARSRLGSAAGAVEAPQRLVEAARSGRPDLAGRGSSSQNVGRNGNPKGGIDRASTGSGAIGGPATRASALPGTTVASLLPAPDAAARTPQPGGDASSAARSGDDGPGQGPFPGPTGTYLFGGPAGLALLGAILTALLLLAPRWRSRLLHMSSARRGLTAISTPIERPG